MKSKKTDIHASVCKRLEIPKDVCYIKFCKGKPVRTLGFAGETVVVDELEVPVDHSGELGYTIRGEQMFVDYDKNGDVIGIELLSSKQCRKPCMDGKRRKK